MLGLGLGLGLELGSGLGSGLGLGLAFFKFGVPELAKRISRQKPVECSFVSDKIRSSG